MLSQLGFRCAVTYIPGWNSDSTDQFELRRIFIRADEDLSAFKTKLLGLDIIPARALIFISGLDGKRRL
jgi:hypothetical protein